MQKNQTASPLVGRIVIICGIVAIAAIVGFFVLRWNADSDVYWSGEFFSFKSGPHCLVFHEPKLLVFIDGEGSEEIFDSVDSYCTSSITAYDRRSRQFRRNPVSSSGHTQLGNLRYVFECRRGETSLRFDGGKDEVVFSERGTKLTLADGREFTLDGKTPVWLRCKPDGTIDHLDELPESFVEFFESPPSEPGMIRSVKSYPDAFY